MSGEARPLVRWALAVVAGAAVLAALALGATTRSLGLDLIDLREANDDLRQAIAQRDDAVSALESELQRLRNLVDGLEARQAPDVVSVAVVPAPGADGVVEAAHVEVHVGASGPTTHVVLLFHPAAGGAEGPGGEGPPSPLHVVDLRRGGRQGWVLRWDVPPGAHGTLYVAACHELRCMRSAAAAVVRSPEIGTEAEEAGASGDAGD